MTGSEQAEPGDLIGCAAGVFFRLLAIDGEVVTLAPLHTSGEVVTSTGGLWIVARGRS